MSLRRGVSRRDVALALVTVGSALAVAGTAHALANLRGLRRPSPTPPATSVPISLLLPMRDEEPRARACLVAALTQVGVPHLEVIVLDDGSTDDTARVVRDVMAEHPEVDTRLLVSPDAPLPHGWLGKPWASERLAAESCGDVLVFVDADVVLAPHAVAAAVALLRDMGADLISPYPRQLANGPLPRLVQPLLQWSWLTTVPLRASETSARPSLSVANGQFLVVDAAAYRRAGGFAAVRSEVLDDVALLRAVKRSGGRGTVVDGTHLATCRMYDTGPELVAGYTKSLWSALGSPAGSAAAVGALALAYVIPPLAALVAPSRPARLIGLAGYAAAVGGRVAVARATGQRVLPDALAHPASVVALASLTAMSWVRLRRGELTWKGRGVTVPPPTHPGGH